MTPEQFDNLVEEQLEICQTMLATKQTEYSQGRDRLDQFKKGANFINCKSEQILAGFMLKHTTSIYDMINSDQEFPLEKWEEKITDHINYLLLLKGIIIEKEWNKIPISEIKKEPEKMAPKETIGYGTPAESGIPL